MWRSGRIFDLTRDIYILAVLDRVRVERQTWFLIYCVVPYGAVVRWTMILCPVDAWAIVWRVGLRYVGFTGDSSCCC